MLVKKTRKRQRFLNSKVRIQNKEEKWGISGTRTNYRPMLLKYLTLPLVRDRCWCYKVAFLTAACLSLLLSRHMKQMPK